MLFESLQAVVNSFESALTGAIASATRLVRVVVSFFSISVKRLSISENDTSPRGPGLGFFGGRPRGLFSVIGCSLSSADMIYIFFYNRYYLFFLQTLKFI